MEKNRTLKIIVITGWVLVGLLGLMTVITSILHSEVNIANSILVLGLTLMVANVTIFLSLPNSIKEGRKAPLGRSILVNSMAIIITLVTTAYVLTMVLGYMYFLSYDNTNPKTELAAKEETLEQMTSILNNVKLEDRAFANALITEFIADGGKFEINGSYLNEYKDTVLGLTTYELVTRFENTAHLPYEFDGLSIVIRETDNEELMAYELLHELGHYLDYKARACGKTVDLENIYEFGNNKFGVSAKYLQREVEQIPELFAQWELGYIDRIECETVDYYYRSCIKDNVYKKSNLSNYYSTQSYYGNANSKLFMAAATLILAKDMIIDNFQEFAGRALE